MPQEQAPNSGTAKTAFLNVLARRTHRPVVLAGVGRLGEQAVERGAEVGRILFRLQRGARDERRAARAAASRPTGRHEAHEGCRESYHDGAKFGREDSHTTGAVRCSPLRREGTTIFG